MLKNEVKNMTAPRSHLCVTGSKKQCQVPAQASWRVWSFHNLWSHSQSTSSPIQKVQGPSTKTSIKREGGILTSELLAPSSLKGVNFSALFLHSHKEKGQLPRGAGGKCPSYALQALLTFHWEMYALREVGLYLGNISNSIYHPTQHQN